MSRPAPEPNEPFFTREINDKFISMVGLRSEIPAPAAAAVAINKYQVLTLDEFLEKLETTTMTEVKKDDIIKVLLSSLCRGINQHYAGDIVKDAIKYDDYDAIILANNDSDRSDNPSDPKRPKDESDPNLKILESIVGFLIVQKGECKTYPRDYSVNLICVRDGVARGTGQVLLGLYLYTILERQKTTGYLQRGLLELAGGYYNIEGLCMDSKFGFVPSIDMAIADCFPYAENMPMKLDFQTKYVNMLDDVRSDSDNEEGYTTPPPPATPDPFTTPDHASDNVRRENMTEDEDEIENAKQIVCSIVTGDHEGFKLPICNIRENQHALIALSEYIRLHEYLITRRIDFDTFEKQCSRTNELKLIYSMFITSLKTPLHDFIDNLIFRMESIDHDTLDQNEKEFIQIISSVGPEYEINEDDFSEAVAAYSALCVRMFSKDLALQTSAAAQVESPARGQKPGGGRNKKTAKRDKRNKKTMKRNKMAAKQSKRKRKT